MWCHLDNSDFLLELALLGYQQPILVVGFVDLTCQQTLVATLGQTS